MNPSFNTSDLELSIPDRFARALKAVDGKLAVAVEVDDTALSFEQLDLFSSALACDIVERLGQGSPGRQQGVALLLPHSSWVFVGILGVLRSGHFFVPLEPGNSEPSAKIVADAAPSLLVTTSRLRDAPELAGTAPVLLIDELEIGQPWSGSSIDPDAIAALLYTSGSTGGPRGVIRTHRLFMHTILNTLDFSQPQSRVAFLGSYTLAGTLRCIFGPLLMGATAYVANLRELPGLRLFEWLRDYRINAVSLSPGVFRFMAALEQPFPLPDLRVVNVGQEPLSRHDVNSFFRHLSSGTKLTFLFGTTECGGISTFDLEKGQSWVGDQTPAGTAVSGCRLVILDDDLHPVADGVTGQIGVRSRELGPGYWNRPDETRARFLPDPEDEGTLYLTGDAGRLVDGVLEHRGRLDFMLKIRGYRVEPFVIEAALAGHPAVKEAVVTAFKDRKGNPYLAAFYLSRGAPAKADELRSSLEGKLSPHEIPSRFVCLTAFPLLPSGKVDRKALPAPPSSRPEISTAFVAPDGEEVALAVLWAEILEIDSVGINDSFYELGATLYWGWK